MKGGGPTVELVLSANVCMPDLWMSTEVLDFDSVMIGRSRKMFFKLQNNGPVLAKWNFRLPATTDVKVVNGCKSRHPEGDLMTDFTGHKGASVE